jgi:hypothetical protein
MTGLLQVPGSAQTIDDGLMIPRNTLFSGYLYTHDSWDHYWEGTLFRENGNLGTVTTQTSTISANYGITDKINVIGLVPYVWTNSSQGVLKGQSGFQDLTLAVKWRIASVPLTDAAKAHIFIVPTWSVPLTDYIADFQPFSIGTHSDRISLRGTVFLQTGKGWFVNGTGAYTWRDIVTLDRPYYFTNGQFFTTNQVDMPHVVEFAVSPGYMHKGLMAQFNFNKYITQGGPTSGDIRPQDFPFVSNRVISTRVGGMFMTPLPWIHRLTFRVEYSYVIDGRNTGQSSTITTGLLSTIHFKKRSTP